MDDPSCAHDHRLDVSPPPAARWGFALAAPVLVLAGGQRTITLTLAAGPLPAAWAAACEARATGPQGWVPLAVQAAGCCAATASVRLTLRLREDQPALVGYDAAAHGPGFDTPWPVLQFTGPADAHAAGAARPFAGLRLGVRVRGLRALQLSNQVGHLDSRGAFFPFGPSAMPADYLLVGAAELAHKKRVRHARVQLTWQSLPPAPGGFAAYYAGYGQALRDDSFRVEAAHWAGGAWHATAPQALFRRARTGGLAPATVLAFGAVPAFGPTGPAPQLRLRLTAPACGFGAGLYPLAVMKAARGNARTGRPPAPVSPAGDLAPRPLPNPPFAPVVQRATLSYRAEAVRHPGLISPEPEVRFYHLTAHAVTEPPEGSALLPAAPTDDSNSSPPQ